jgi:hypothetical protein
MALTAFQKRVLGAIARNRSPESHIAGGTALALRSLRVSNDIDIFHDAQDAAGRSAERDIASLEKAGLSVEVTRRGGGFIEGVVKDAGGDEVKIQWATDSAVRFFPVVEDDALGYRLHDLDLAVNKVLAMAGRREPRDYYDVIRLHQSGIPLAALAWAAPAKDPGYTPELIIDEINRNSNYTEAQLQADIHAPDLPGARRMKEALLAASREARDLFQKLPLEQVGHLYLDSTGRPVLPDPQGVRDGRLKLHSAVVRGAWPQLGEVPKPSEGAAIRPKRPKR